MSIILTVLVIACVVLWLCVIDRSIILTPGSIFFFYNSLIVIQTINLAESIDKYIVFIFLSLLAFLLGTRSVDLFYKINVGARYREWTKQNIRLTKWTIGHQISLWLVFILVSLGVSFSGGLVPYIAIKELLAFGLDDASRVYVDSRIAISHGDAYLAPGYIAQIKDYIFPTLVVIYYLRKVYTKKVGFLARLLMALAMVFLLSSGTRSGLLIFIVAILYVRVKPLDSKLILDKKGFILSLVFLFCVFGGLTFLMGRAGESASLAQGVFKGFNQVLDRVANVTAVENLKLFQEHDIVKESVFGHEWLVGLSTVLPGRQVPYSIYFAELVGYSRGNVPLNALSGLYFNFNYFGVFVSFLYGAILRWILIKLLGQRKTIEAVVCLTFLSFHIGLALNPLGLLLYGAVAVSFLWFLLSIRYAR